MSQLGIHISRTRLRLALVEEGRIRRQQEVDIPRAGDYTDVLAGSLREYGAGGRRGCRAVVVPGLAESQSKRLDGLPPVRRLTDLRDVVREGAEGYFVGDPDCVVLVRRVSDAVVADRYDARLIDQIRAAARHANVGHVTVVSAASALAAATGVGKGTISEDGIVLHVVCERGRPDQIRRLRAGSEAATAPDVRRAAEFDLAIGGIRAVTSGNAAHHIRVRTGPWGMTRKIAAAAGVAAVAAGLAFAPIAQWRWQSRRASGELASLGTAYRAAAIAGQELADAQTVSARVQRWARTGPNLIVGFAALVRALPAGSAIAALTADSAGGSFTVIAPHAASILAAVDASPDLGDVHVVGSVVSDNAGGAGLERASLRFSFRKRP